MRITHCGLDDVPGVFDPLLVPVLLDPQKAKVWIQDWEMAALIAI